ncbi:MAG: aminoacyl-tRNA hydrolase [Phycisphaerae bacterium]
MKLVVGLGNPGPQYAASRHNIGFMVLDELARRWKTGPGRFDRDFQGALAEAQRGDERVLLLKPATYMNLSGQSVASVVRFYRLALADMLVVSDDLDLPPGAMRIRAAGSSGGHRGLDSIIRMLASQEFARARIGIGKVHRDATVDYVLGRVDARERNVFDEAIRAAADAVDCWVTNGAQTTMNRFNRRPADESPKP